MLPPQFIRAVQSKPESAVHHGAVVLQFARTWSHNASELLEALAADPKKLFEISRELTTGQQTVLPREVKGMVNQARGWAGRLEATTDAELAEIIEQTKHLKEEFLTQYHQKLETIYAPDYRDRRRKGKSVLRRFFGK